MFTYRFPSMSTIVQISISQELFANDLMPIYKLFELIEDTCSRFRSDSELSRLNQHVDKEVIVSSEMFSILSDALRFFEETEGIFNPSILSSLENHGYSKSIEMIKGKELAVTPPSSMAAISSLPFILNESKRSVTLLSKIDLGGMAKGWVIDRAALLLDRLGYGFINVGGDIRIFGTLPRTLNIGIESPFAETTMISSIQVQNGALATSTTMKRTWRMNGEWTHHLIDTRTGNPSKSKIVSATVTAPTALEADVWAKTVLLLGKQAGQEWINRKGVQAVLITKDGDIWRGGE
ncbi:FAD:protein FMN transferase [Neobacillus sp. BF23-41]|uniref:FAD:protein FMN transferase n=1 Tax=Neobacillus sp. BF23-41 TaxID=3240280 RepID=UPI0034E5FD6F